VKPAPVDLAAIPRRRRWFVVTDDGDTVGSLCSELETLRKALIKADHTPWCATNCQHAIHDCDCGWQEAVEPYLPTAEDVRGILA
jgi:hypothetical protein